VKDMPVKPKNESISSSSICCFSYSFGDFVVTLNLLQ